jgi:hypothetical protein
MTLRARLVVGAAAAVAIGIVISSGVVYILVRNELRGQLDATLLTNARTIAFEPQGIRQAIHILGYGNNHVYQLYVTVPQTVGYYQLVDAAGNVYIPTTASPRRSRSPATRSPSRPARRTRTTTTPPCRGTTPACSRSPP